jgi:hypothetical protein
MKKWFSFFFCLTVFACIASARDFDVSWIEQMSKYIGAKIDDVPYSFSRYDDGYYFEERSKVGGLFGIGGRNIVEVISADSKKNILLALWYMDSWLSGDETKELSEIRTAITDKYGQPNKEGVWVKKSSGLFGTSCEIRISRDSSDGSACVLIQKKESGFERRWGYLLKGIGVK